MSKIKLTTEDFRTKVLKSLVSGDTSIEKLTDDLKKIEFDSEPLVILTANHITSMLIKFINNQISSNYIEQWANLLEVRDDIEFDQSNQPNIKDAIYQLANPTLSGTLDENMAQCVIYSLASK